MSSVFPNCSGCDKIAEIFCDCRDPPYLFCEIHTMDHTSVPGRHSVRDAVKRLSEEEISQLRNALKNYQISSIRKANLIRDSILQKLFSDIRKVNDEYTAIAKNILSGPIQKLIKEIISNGSLPLNSQNSFVESLLSFKEDNTFKEKDIQKYFKSVLPSSKSSSVQLYSVQSWSSQTLPRKKDATQTSSKPSLSVKTLTYISIPQRCETNKTKWGLLKQYNDAHQSHICSIAISNCERYLASASNDNTIKIWDLDNLQLNIGLFNNNIRLIRTLKGHTDTVRSVVFLGNKVVSGSNDKTIKIWEEDRCLITLQLHSNVVSSVCVSSCKKFIVSGSWDNTIVVYDLETRTVHHTLRGHSGIVTSVALSPNNKEIVSGGIDKSIKVWNTDTGQLLKTLDGHSSFVACVSFYGEFIVSCSLDQTVRIWNRKTGENSFILCGHSSHVMSIDVLNNLIVSLGTDDKIIVWDARTGAKIQSFEGHGNHINDLLMCARIMKEGKFIVSVGVDKNIKVWKRIR